MELDFGLYIINSDGTGMRPMTGEELLQRGLLFHLPFVPAEMVERAEEAGHFRRYYSALQLFHYEGIRWLPNGSAWIEPGEDGLYVVRADGTGSIRVAQGRVYNFDLSPDGGTIAYAEGTTIYSIEIDGSKRRELAGFQARAVGDVYWSPKGDQILISTSRGPGAVCVDDLYLVNFDTQRIQSLFHLPRLRESCLHNSQWSSDGQHVEFILCDRENATTFFMSITKNGDDLQQIAQITGLGSCFERVAWSPDHTQFVFSLFLEEGLYILDPNNGHYWQILSGYVPGSPIWLPEP